MPESGRREPRAATVEDWDDDAQTALPGSRTTANVATKRPQQELTTRSREQRPSNDATDQGYASRAETLVTEPTGRSRRKMPDLKLDTGIPERERQPYHVPQSAPAKPPTRRQSSCRDKDLDAEPRLAKIRPIVHKRGTCPVCDQYGEHIDLKQERSRTSNVAPPPLSPTSLRQSAPRGVNDGAFPGHSRRPSADGRPRPVSIATAAPVPVHYYNPAVYGPPVVASPGWVTPITPSMSYNTPTYSYAPISPSPGTSFNHYQHFPQYVDALYPLDPPSNRPSRRPSPVRRSSTYGDPVIRQRYPDESTARLERASPAESRPSFESRNSGRSHDDDRIAMPPPPQPPIKQKQPEVVLGRRPSNRRAQTYHPSEPPVRERYYESDHYDDDHFDVPKSRGPPSGTKDRRESFSRPPNSYRGPATIDRPSLSRNYTTPTATTNVASSKPQEIPRRTTRNAVPLEQKEADVEEYLRRGSKTSGELTAEALRKLERRNSSNRSETGSSYSHKSLQSSSKDSSGRGRSHTSGTRTSITLGGGINMTIPADYVKEGRPLSMVVNGLVISVNPDGKGQDRSKEQRAIERAPSVNSRESRKSFSSGISSKDRERDPNRPSRRPSYAEERGPSHMSSRQPSRAPSVSQPSYEYTARRQSVDYAGYDIAGA